MIVLEDSAELLQPTPFGGGFVVGSRWAKGGLYEVFWFSGQVQVRWYPEAGMRAEWGWASGEAVSKSDAVYGGIAMASKWISQAVGKAKKRTRTFVGEEPTLFLKRPALRDFMTELAGAEDKPREASVLMIACTDDGVRAGLKDDEAGGWLWRVGESLQEALDAIEKALQTGDAKFTSAASRAGKKAK